MSANGHSMPQEPLRHPASIGIRGRALVGLIGQVENGCEAVANRGRHRFPTARARDP